MSTVPPDVVKDATGADTLQSRPALEKLFQRISEISSLPATAQRIVEMAEDESASGVDLLRAVEGDPALVARILRRVNSAFYGLRHNVADLQSAINLLGFREIRNLALTVHVTRLFDKPGDYRGYSRESLWDHMVAVAVVARLVSNVCQCAVPEEAYLGGLLHDMGFILLDQHLRKHFCQVVSRVDESTLTTEIEQEVFTFDHAELAAFVARKWQFAEQIVAAIRYHHYPERYEGPHQEIVFVVSAANYFCSHAGRSSLGVHNVPAPSDAVYNMLGLQQDKLSMIFEQLDAALEAADLGGGLSG